MILCHSPTRPTVRTPSGWPQGHHLTSLQHDTEVSAEITLCKLFIEQAQTALSQRPSSPAPPAKLIACHRLTDRETRNKLSEWFGEEKTCGPGSDDPGEAGLHHGWLGGPTRFA